MCFHVFSDYQHRSHCKFLLILRLMIDNIELMFYNTFKVLALSQSPSYMSLENIKIVFHKSIFNILIGNNIDVGSNE